MDSYEMSRLCHVVFSTVGGWLERQDALTRTIHRVAVELIQEIGESPVSLLLDRLHYDYPDIWYEQCEGTIGGFASLMLASEFREVSGIFTALYAEFNARYFDACLPTYRVRVMRNIPLPYDPDHSFNPCSIDHRRQEIDLTYDGWPHFIVSRLVHLMAHIHAGPTHGTDWQLEVDRLFRIGAPTDEEIERLEAAGWRPYIARPWLPS